MIAHDTSPYDTLVQQHSSNYAITDCDTSICDCTAGSLSRKERKDHNGAFKATAHDCSARHSCPHSEKENQYGLAAHMQIVVFLIFVKTFSFYLWTVCATLFNQNHTTSSRLTYHFSVPKTL
jgi:hypothetical protein